MTVASCQAACLSGNSSPTKSSSGRSWLEKVPRHGKESRDAGTSSSYFAASVSSVYTGSGRRRGSSQGYSDRRLPTARPWFRTTSPCLLQCARPPRAGLAGYKPNNPNGPDHAITGWHARPTRLCFVKVSRCRHSPTRRSRTATVRCSVRAFVSFSRSMLDSQVPYN